MNTFTHVIRVWAMPNKHTFSITPIHQLLRHYLNDVNKSQVADPFSDGEQEFAGMTNDLNPNVKATHHLDALKFLKSLPSVSYRAVLYDPPYSPRQVSECYHHFGHHVSMWDTSAKWRALQLDQIARVTKVGGLVFSFGWNSNGVLTLNNLHQYVIRKLTPLECWRLQGYPDKLFWKAKHAGVSNSQLYKQAGNSVSVPVIEWIAGRLTIGRAVRDPWPRVGGRK